MLKTRILIVSDDADMIDSLTNNLPESEFRLATASNRISVTFQLALVQPELILLDVGMDWWQGGNIVRTIRENSNVPIIVTSALAEHGMMVEALNMGADDFVAKPFNTRELLSRMRALLRRVDYRSRRNLVSGTVPVS